jgi:hypothetical protein
MGIGFDRIMDVGVRHASLEIMIVRFYLCHV